MIGNPTEGLKPRIEGHDPTLHRGRMIGNPTEGLKLVELAGLEPAKKGPNDRQPD